MASCYFYMGYGIQCFLLLCIVTIISYLVGLALEQNQKPSILKLIMVVMIVIIVCILAYFKYASFLIENVNGILKVTTIQLHPVVQNIGKPSIMSTPKHKTPHCCMA